MTLGRLIHYDLIGWASRPQACIDHDDHCVGRFVKILLTRRGALEHRLVLANRSGHSIWHVRSRHLPTQRFHQAHSDFIVSLLVELLIGSCVSLSSMPPWVRANAPSRGSSIQLWGFELDFVKLASHSMVSMQVWGSFHVHRSLFLRSRIYIVLLHMPKRFQNSKLSRRWLISSLLKNKGFEHTLTLSISLRSCVQLLRCHSGTGSRGSASYSIYRFATTDI